MAELHVGPLIILQPQYKKTSYTHFRLLTETATKTRTLQKSKNVQKVVRMRNPYVVCVGVVSAVTRTCVVSLLP